ncbi:hypothetical protein K438DRAFT_2113284 [Mycena galopus ATCC 62051]|nr:hypothetical protein K438DRAFT_2113284 [Mycena galopus ATCC 62051]
MRHGVVAGVVTWTAQRLVNRRERGDMGTFGDVEEAAAEVLEQEGLYGAVAWRLLWAVRTSSFVLASVPRTEPKMKGRSQKWELSRVEACMLGVDAVLVLAPPFLPALLTNLLIDGTTFLVTLLPHLDQDEIHWYCIGAQTGAVRPEVDGAAPYSRRGRESRSTGERVGMRKRSELGKKETVVVVRVYGRPSCASPKEDETTDECYGSCFSLFVGAWVEARVNVDTNESSMCAYRLLITQPAHTAHGVWGWVRPSILTGAHGDANQLGSGRGGGEGAIERASGRAGVCIGACMLALPHFAAAAQCGGEGKRGKMPGLSGWVLRHERGWRWGGGQPHTCESLDRSDIPCAAAAALIQRPRIKTGIRREAKGEYASASPLMGLHARRQIYKFEGSWLQAPRREQERERMKTPGVRTMNHRSPPAAHQPFSVFPCARVGTMWRTERSKIEEE